MANLSSSLVTITRHWTEGGPANKDRKVLRGYITGDGGSYGGTTNTIPASAFGLRVIERCSTILVDDTTQRVLQGAPSADGTILLLQNPAAAAGAATHHNVGDVALTSTKKHYFEVAGY